MKFSFAEVITASYINSLYVVAQRTGLYDEKKKSDFFNDFINTHKDNFSREVSVENLKVLFNSNAKDCVEMKILETASRLAAGYGPDSELSIKKDDSYKAMKHIMSSLKLDEVDSPSKSYYNLAPLDKDSILASKNSNVDKSQYVKLWNDFESDFLKYRSMGIEKFVTTFDSMLEHYFWAVPLYTGEKMDVGLYQHTRNTAAISSILYKKEDQEPGSLTDVNRDVFMFVNGDISGIQKYIFELKENEFSSKLLRAKSFQLWAISEILSQYICSSFGITSANVVTSAGGKFILMLPLLNDSEKKLSDLQLEIEKYFIDEFAGKLAVIISNGVCAAQKDLLKENAQDLFNRIGSKADECKQYKMQKALSKYGYKLDKHYEKLQINGECPKCGIFPAESTDGNSCCKNCTALVEIGKKLMHGNYISIKCEALKTFGEMLDIIDQPDGFAYSINEYKAGYPLMYLPYVAPKVNNYELKTFEDLAQQSNNKIAMFKSDVDNLGLVFSSSLGENISLSSYADLSHILHYFFSAFYAYFVKNNDDHNGIPFSESIYTVFSGGDDLCILGSWDSIVHFVIQFQKQLKLFTNNNPSVTLSGGIALSSAKNPVSNIARMSEELLEKSKSYPSNSNPLKNAVSIFDTSVSWDDFERMVNNGMELKQYLEKGILSVGVVYKFIDYCNRAEECLNGDVDSLIKSRTWKSHLVYSITRNVKDKEIAEKLKKLGTDATEMVKSRIAVCYALYTQR